MSTTVKLTREDKEKLEKLQALITLKAEAKVNQKDLLSSLIRDAFERGDEIAEKMCKATVPLNEKQFQKLMSLVQDWETKTSWRDVDNVLYDRKERKSKR